MSPGDDDLDLEAALGEALDEQLGGGSQEPPLSREPKQTESAFPRADEMPKPRDYQRDEQGKFAQKPEQPAAPTEPAAKPAWRPMWLKQEHGDWDKYPEQLRAAIEQREKEFAQGIQQHATPAKAWQAIEQRFAPYSEQLKQVGSSVQQELDGLVTTYESLARGDINHRIETLNDLVRRFTGYDGVEHLAYEMQQKGYQPPPQLPPEVQAMRKELAELKQQFGQTQTSAEQQRQAEARQEIEAFSKDKPDFDLLKEHMGALMRSGKAATLSDAYEQARWAHPETRDRMLKEHQRKQVERARAGAQSPRGGPVANGSARTTPKMSLEEELGMLLDGA